MRTVSLPDPLVEVFEVTDDESGILAGFLTAAIFEEFDYMQHELMELLKDVGDGYYLNGNYGGYICDESAYAAAEKGLNGEYKPIWIIYKEGETALDGRSVKITGEELRFLFDQACKLSEELL